ncbi:CRISPR-associated endonuclease Cas1 [Methylohalobius crimeensis]|uniref:CRISPR-associated endonuclease Cas1 n=1 Tax=Methylohalobius crimeensis TaxID=244365 RepID=UPI0003B32361|nr:CRISPR-associated endonuclease Cas1 [Methylohalobius crimeensis]
MSTFYLDRSGSEITLESDVLVVRHREGRQAVPLALLERLVISAKTGLDTLLLGRLAERGVTVLLLDPRRLDRRAQVLGTGHNDVTVRLAQYRTADDEAIRLARAKGWIQAKVRRHRRLLAETAGNRPDLCPALMTAVQRLESSEGQINTAASLTALRGFEGSASQVFFGAYRTLFAPSLGFSGRKRRPPPDPVNATLSLAYTLLHARAVQAAWAAGLDPQVGFYHHPAWGRESLACDLIEPWRPAVDGWVYEWFRDRRLRSDHFKYRGGGCFLDKAGRNRFFAAFEQNIAPLQRALRRQCRELVRYLNALEES